MTLVPELRYYTIVLSEGKGSLTTSRSEPNSTREGRDGCGRVPGACAGGRAGHGGGGLDPVAPQRKEANGNSTEVTPRCATTRGRGFPSEKGKQDERYRNPQAPSTPEARADRQVLAELAAGNPMLFGRITVDGKPSYYCVGPLPSDFGKGFRFEKPAPDTNVYDALLETTGDSCTCKGHIYGGFCKHVDCGRALIGAGKLS